MKLVLPFIVLTTILSSCGNKKSFDEAKKTSKRFFEAIKFEETDTLYSLYPGLVFLDSYYLSDSININDVLAINDSTVKVSIENSYTNGFGKKTNTKIDLFISKDSIGKYSTISESQGLTDIKSNKFLLFAKAIGCLGINDTTDIQQSLNIEIARLKAERMALELYSSLRDSVKITSWKWSRGYLGSASGKGVVKNNSTVPISNIKYKIYYKTSSGSVFTTDEGYVSYDYLYPNEVESFSFYTSYIGNCKAATASLQFDSEQLLEIILRGSYTGEECNEYGE